jgi:hypothetical protein
MLSRAKFFSNDAIIKPSDLLKYEYNFTTSTGKYLPFSVNSLSVTEECEVLTAVSIMITVLYVETRYRPVETYGCF